MTNWTQDNAAQELIALLRETNHLTEQLPLSVHHYRWLLRTKKVLSEVFGNASLYYRHFSAIQWQYSGTIIMQSGDDYNPGIARLRYDQPVYLHGLEKAAGIIHAAYDCLVSDGIEQVYHGKNTGPEASLLIQIINLAEMKLRKVMRKIPQKEREIQDAFETLLIGADIPYTRERETILYSSKTYIPDFIVSNADLAIELKLSIAPSHEKDFIAQINDDILAYQTKYGNLLFVVYDCGFIRDVDRFVSSFESHGAVCVRVVKH